MLYLEFLRELHARLEPRTYLEIGVERGYSLALSRCRSIGVDPDFTIDQELVAPVSLLRCTSDDYFAELERIGAAPFRELPVDFAFIDGMHLLECALRDFICLERHAGPNSVIAFDDVLPRNIDEAARRPASVNWAGDVFRIVDVLRAHRPDLAVLVVNTAPTGTLLVSGLDPTSTVLAERMDDILRHHVHPDPQVVPAKILGRRGTRRPDTVLAMGLWDQLRAARAGSA